MNHLGIRWATATSSTGSTSTTCSHIDGIPEGIEQIAPRSPDSGRKSRTGGNHGSLYHRHARRGQRKELATENEIEDALPGATGRREKRALLRIPESGKRERSYMLPVSPQEYRDRLPLEGGGPRSKRKCYGLATNLLEKSTLYGMILQLDSCKVA